MPSSRVPAVTVNVLKPKISLQLSLKAHSSNVLLGRKWPRSGPKLGMGPKLCVIPYHSAAEPHFYLFA